jgi:hypothetical protein
LVAPNVTLSPNPAAKLEMSSSEGHRPLGSTRFIALFAA